MKAIRVHQQGGPEVMSYEDVPEPEVGPDQALVRHTAIGVNFIDTYHRSGLYPVEGEAWGLGVEAAGVVEAIGSEVTDVAVGERVAYVVGPGCYADKRAVPANKLVPLPTWISDEQAAAAMVKGMTVEYLVQRTFPVTADHTVLWHAVAGGVGLFACQWLSAIGARIIGTCGSDEKAALAREHGCDEVIVYTRENVPVRVHELTENNGVDVVYDAVGKATFMDSLDCLKRRGMMVAFGNASGTPDPVAPLELSRRGSLYLTRPTLFDYIATRDELLNSSLALFERARNGDIQVAVNHRWALEDAADAHRALEGRETTGSIVLLP